MSRSMMPLMRRMCMSSMPARPFASSMPIGIQQPHQPSRHNLSSSSSSGGVTASDPFHYMSLLPMPEVWLTADDELKMLPEIGEAVACTQRGDFKQAEELLNRARDVGVAVVGETGELTKAADRKLLALTDMTSNIPQAKMILKRLLAGLSEEEGEDMHERLLLTQCNSRIYLQIGDVNTASRFARDSVSLACNLNPESLEGQMADVMSLELLSWCELWMGTRDLIDGTLLAEILKGNDELAVNAQTYAQHAVVASGYGSAGAMECLVHNKADKAILLWEKGSKSMPDTASGISDQDDEDEEDEAASEHAKFMHTLFRCANYNNIGMAWTKQANFDEAANVLTTSMNLAQEVKPTNMKSREGALYSVCFARTMRLLARVMHAQENAVSAEGLYRNAIDTLEAIPAATGQLRPTHAYELVNAWEDFARLLDQWEKRESEAKALRAKIKTLYHGKIDTNLNRIQCTFNANLGWSL